MTVDLERELPQSLAAERHVLASIIVNNDALDIVQKKLKPEDFFHDHHRRIYRAMMGLYGSDHPIDEISLVDELKRRGELDLVPGGVAFVSALGDGMPSVSNVGFHATIIKSKALLRSLIRVTDNVQQEALAAHDDVKGIIDRARSAIVVLANEFDQPKPMDRWPAPIGDDAFRGVTGEFCRAVEPATEADQAALMANFLVAAGTLFGHSAYAVADGKRHYPNEFVLTVGESGAAGRKGTATSRTLPLMERVEPGFRDRILSGLSSGEGLIKSVAPAEGEPVGGIRRFLVVLQEFASLLCVMAREGNLMSVILREAWDSERLRVLTRKEPLDVDGVNLGVIAHITPGELLNRLGETDRINGFANRFLIVAVRRSQFLPEAVAEPDLNDIVARLREAVEAARCRGQMCRNFEARELWAVEYPKLTAARGGIEGALCSRAEAHSLRLQLLYALLDCADEIRVEHVRAALAFWAYCEASIRHVFGGASGDPDGDKILRALAAGPCTLTELHWVFGRNRKSDWISAKLSELERAGRIRKTTKPGSRKSAVPAWELNCS